jgi:hypothetical protein
LNAPPFLLPSALVICGAGMLVIYPLGLLWPEAWSWGEAGFHYAEMLFAVYAALGLCLIRAARRPSEHRSLIDFTIFSSLVHGALMAWQSFSLHQHVHLLTDVLAMFGIAAVLAVLRPPSLPGQG